MTKNKAYQIMLKVQQARDELKEARMLSLKYSRLIFKLAAKEKQLIDEMMRAIKQT